MEHIGLTPDGTSQPEIAMGVHQYARFTNQTMLLHDCALCWIVKYLSTTSDRESFMTPILILAFN
eukprot:6688932-Ditylum_brightwellii.AAC.1